MLRAQVFQRLLQVVALDIVAPDYKAVLGRNPQLEVTAIAHHVKSFVANDREQANHAQHGGLAHEYVTADLLIVDDLALFYAAYRRIDIDRSLQGLYFGGLSVEVVDQFRLSGGL
jgi:hypothetical protein